MCIIFLWGFDVLLDFLRISFWVWWEGSNLIFHGHFIIFLLPEYFSCSHSLLKLPSCTPISILLIVGRLPLHNFSPCFFPMVWWLNNFKIKITFPKIDWQFKIKYLFRVNILESLLKKVLSRKYQKRWRNKS